MCGGGSEMGERGRKTKTKMNHVNLALKMINLWCFTCGWESNCCSFLQRFTDDSHTPNRAQTLCAIFLSLTPTRSLSLLFLRASHRCALFVIKLLCCQNTVIHHHLFRHIVYSIFLARMHVIYEILFHALSRYLYRW